MAHTNERGARSVRYSICHLGVLYCGTPERSSPCVLGTTIALMLFTSVCSMRNSFRVFCAQIATWYSTPWKTKARAWMLRRRLQRPSLTIKRNDEEEQAKIIPQIQSNKNPPNFLYYYKGVAIAALAVLVLLIVVVMAARTTKRPCWCGVDNEWCAQQHSSNDTITTANNNNNCNPCCCSPADCRRGELVLLLSRVHQRNNRDRSHHNRHYTYLSRSVDTVD